VLALFRGVLLAKPAVLLGSPHGHTRAGRKQTRVGSLAVRYSYASFLWIWDVARSYGFHFFTGILTIVPVTQAALASVGIHLLGARNGRDRVADSRCPAHGIRIYFARFAVRFSWYIT